MVSTRLRWGRCWTVLFLVVCGCIVWVDGAAVSESEEGQCAEIAMEPVETDEYEDAYYYYVESNAPAGDHNEIQAVELAPVSGVVSNSILIDGKAAFNSNARFKVRTANTKYTDLSTPLVNDITLNRTQHLFSCKAKRHGRIHQIQELRQKAKNYQEHEEVAADDLFGSKLLITRQKTDKIKASMDANEAVELKQKLGGKGMSAGQRKAFADVSKHTVQETPHDAVTTEASINEQQPAPDTNTTAKKKSVLQTAIEAKLKNSPIIRATPSMIADASTTAAESFSLECASLICQSCKLFIREANYALAVAAKDLNVVYIDDVINSDFCGSQRIRGKYAPIFDWLCEHFFVYERAHYYYVLLGKLVEATSGGDVSLVPAELAQLTELACTTLGACGTQNFHITFKPSRREEEEWTDGCYICQEYGKQLEEQIALMNDVSDKSLDAMVADICQYLQLEPMHYNICTDIYNSKAKMRNIGYMVKILSDHMRNGKPLEKQFSDGLCEV
jgi:hypothetical protein